MVWWLPQNPLWDHGLFTAQVWCSNCAVSCHGYHTIRLSLNALNLVKQSRTLWGPPWYKSFLCPPFLVCMKPHFSDRTQNQLKWRLGHEPTFFFFLTLFYFTILYWFCHTLTWICHRYTCVPNLEPPSLLPPHTISMGHPSAPAPSILYPASNLDLAIHFLHAIIHVSMPFSQIIPPSPSPAESKRMFYTPVSFN